MCGIAACVGVTGAAAGVGKRTLLLERQRRRDTVRGG